MDGWTDRQTNGSPPVFYRTSAPSGPLPKRFVHGAERPILRFEACSWAAEGPMK